MLIIGSLRSQNYHRPPPSTSAQRAEGRGRRAQRGAQRRTESNGRRKRVLPFFACRCFRARKITPFRLDPPFLLFVLGGVFFSSPLKNFKFFIGGEEKKKFPAFSSQRKRECINMKNSVVFFILPLEELLLPWRPKRLTQVVCSCLFYILQVRCCSLLCLSFLV